MVGRHESTGAYWIGRYGLLVKGAERHPARGGIEREQLEALVGEGKTIAEIAATAGAADAARKQSLDDAAG